MTLIPVILCGGAGSSLWPVARELRPKPFIRLADGLSLLQKAFLCGTGLRDVTHIVTVAERELFFQIEDEYRGVNASGVDVSFILEPCSRDTAAAVAAATLHVAARHGEDALLLVLSADHLIADRDAFGRAVLEAKTLACQGRLVVFGIPPDDAETGRGCIRNSGMLCCAAGTMAAELERHCPDVWSSVRDCMRQSRPATGRDFRHVELDAAMFSRVPEAAIDSAVMERSASVAVVPCDAGWSDIGSWDVLADLLPADPRGNCVEGEALLHEVSNTYVRGGERMVGAVGVDGLVIIDTPDALLVAGRSHARDVGQVYAALQSRGHEAYRLHRTVYRPWGSYTVLEEGECYKIKRLVVRPGASLSRQMHQHRSEHWVVVSGSARVVNGEMEKLLAVNESTYIPAGCVHRLGNPGLLDLVLIEVQSGDYLGEDDIVRLEDDYGRC